MRLHTNQRFCGFWKPELQTTRTNSLTIQNAIPRLPESLLSVGTNGPEFPELTQLLDFLMPSSFIIWSRWMEVSNPDLGDSDTWLDSTNLVSVSICYEFPSFIQSGRAKTKDMWMTFHPAWNVPCPALLCSQSSQVNMSASRFFGKSLRVTALTSAFPWNTVSAATWQICPFLAPGLVGIRTLQICLCCPLVAVSGKSEVLSLKWI